MTELRRVRGVESKERLSAGGVLIIGASGMVGLRFLKLFEGDFVTPSRGELDITDPEQVRAYIEREKPDVVINFAAYTDVNGGENQRGNQSGSCWQKNVEGVKNILAFIDPKKTHFIQISTDMVYSGLPNDPGPYSENHPPEDDPDKLTWYGYTKREAERLIREKMGDKATILRIICPTVARFERKLDFLRKPLSLYDEGGTVSAFVDQQISMTFVDEACEALKRIIEGNRHGIFHCSSNTGTPFEVFTYLLKKARGADNVVVRSSLEEAIRDGRISPVRYTLKGGLDDRKTRSELEMNPNNWKLMIDKLVKQGIGNN